MLTLKSLAIYTLLVSSSSGCLKGKGSYVVAPMFGRQTTQEEKYRTASELPEKTPTPSLHPIDKYTVALGAPFLHGCPVHESASGKLLVWYHENNEIGSCMELISKRGSLWRDSSQNCSCHVKYWKSVCYLYIKNISAEALGKYSCRPSGGRDIRLSLEENQQYITQYAQHFTTQFTTQSTPQYTPQFAPQYVEAHRGDDVNLTCDIDMKGQDNDGEWFNGTSPIRRPIILHWTITEDKRWKLGLRNVQVKDSQIYTCRLSNVRGYFSRSVLLRVLPTPRNFKEVNAQMGENVTLVCPVKFTDNMVRLQWWSGYKLPGPYIRWKPDRQPQKWYVNSTNLFYEIQWTFTEWNVHISNATKAYAGEYICSTRFKSGDAERHYFKLNVVRKAQRMS